MELPKLSEDGMEYVEILYRIENAYRVMPEEEAEALAERTKERRLELIPKLQEGDHAAIEKLFVKKVRVEEEEEPESTEDPGIHDRKTPVV